MKLKPNQIFQICLVGLVLILFAIIIFRKPTVIVTSDREQVLQDSVKLLRSQRDSSLGRQAKIQNSFDSLMNLDPQIKYRTHEKIKFIFNTASPRDLDSIIRTNWKTSSRYR